MKTLSIQISDAEAQELLTKRTAAQWRQWLKDVVKFELQDIRKTAAVNAVTQPDDTAWTATLV